MDDFLQTIKEPIVLDVGANVGHHTLFAAMRSKQVICFEPFQDVAWKLEQKVSENKLNNVMLFKCALGEKNETAFFVEPQGHNTGTGKFVNFVTSSNGKKLPIRIGDEILAENDISNIHFIKIDTEGFEPHVLKGLKNTITRCRPLVFFEWTQEKNQAINQSHHCLFPGNYRYFQFIADTVLFYFFRKQTYRLVPIYDYWPDGNLFAVPIEYIENLEKYYPSSNAAKQVMQ